MYLVRSPRERASTWSPGRYDPEARAFVKYESEFASACAMATRVRTAADWERGDWRGFDRASWRPPEQAGQRRLARRMDTAVMVARDRLLRPGLLRRLAARLRREGGSEGDAAAPVSAQEYAGFARRRGWSPD